jgi:hypothetical protein
MSHRITSGIGYLATAVLLTFNAWMQHKLSGKLVESKLPKVQNYDIPKKGDDIIFVGTLQCSAQF